MKAKFGIFEEVDNADFVKQWLTEYFESLALKQFNQVFVSYPHQCLSDDYEPETSSDETLEIYFYSVPSKLSASLNRVDSLKFSERFSLSGGQRDFLVVTSGPKKYQFIEDQDGLAVAIVEKNKIWVLFDLFHGVSSDSKFMKSALDYIIENTVNPPSPEELEERISKHIGELCGSYLKNLQKNCENQLKVLRAESRTAYGRYEEMQRRLAEEVTMHDILKMKRPPTGREIHERLKAIPYVEGISLERGSLAIHTRPIELGPLNFGAWKICLKPSWGEMYHEHNRQVLHPYEYDDNHYCMGGFAEQYVEDMKNGDLVKALSICRLLITQYSTGTRMHDLIIFLAKVMGKDFAKHMKAIKEEHFKDAEDVTISNINGATVTYVSIIKKANGDKIPSSERVEINYAK